MTSNHNIIANAFNQFFNKIGTKLAATIMQPENTNFKQYLGNPTEVSFQYEKVSELQVAETIDKLPPYIYQLITSAV